MIVRLAVFALALSLFLSWSVFGETSPDRFEPADVFELEWASDPRISPGGEHIVYVRNSMDIMRDTTRSRLWLLRTADGEGRPLGTPGNAGNPRWSPDGRRLLYTAADEYGNTQLFLRWLDSGEAVRLTQLPHAPSGLVFSPDGRQIAFSMLVPTRRESMVKMPEKPEGAEWAEPAIYIDEVLYRSDGAGYLEPGFHHLFVLPAEGGTPRQVTQGNFHHQGPISWLPDGSALIFSANREEGWRLNPGEGELYELHLAKGTLRALTERHGPDQSPAVSPDGQHIAYLGYDNRYLGYQSAKLYVLERASGAVRCLTEGLDRSVSSPQWADDGNGLFFNYDDRGNGKIAYVDLEGSVRELAGDLGGTSLGRPYGGGSFTTAGGHLAYTLGRPHHPADVAVLPEGGEVRRLTRLNEDLFGHKELGAVEEIWYKSSHDGRRIQGWIVKPPGFDGEKKYPMVLEIHGGPFANYGDRFSAEAQLFASAGYVVLYTNPRGSSSYGEDFGNLIHHNYPGNDYDDLMSGVDALLGKGYVDSERLYVTGGSGGGVLTAWIVGHTDRFKAAVVAKPVINWTSFVLTADAYNFFYKYWFPGPPWEHAEHYHKRSPLSYVGKVKTPTMLLTGETDYRTPISESEQYYQALKLNEVDTALVRLPDTSHGIARRPSRLISKVAHILTWFGKYGGEAVEE